MQWLSEQIRMCGILNIFELHVYKFYICQFFDLSQVNEKVIPRGLWTSWT